MKRMREEEVEDGSRGTRERGCRFCGFRFGLHTRLPVSLTGCLLALHRQQQQQQHHQQRSPPLLSLSLTAPAPAFLTVLSDRNGKLIPSLSSS